MPDLSALLAAASAWAAADPDPETAAEAARLIAAQDAARLADHFGPRLVFGTAGMRGALGAGPNRMNRALVRQVSAGLGDCVRALVPDAAERGVVVGYDGRRGSRVFAEDTAAVLGARGFVVYLFDEVVPTPVLAHALLFLGAAAGVMVTASHNPPQDNGYKVYWENGAQIIPPQDAAISDAIDAVARSVSGTVPDTLRGQGSEREASGVGRVRRPTKTSGRLSEGIPARGYARQAPSPGAVAVAPLDELRAAGRLRPVPTSAWEDYLRRVLEQRVHREGGVRAVYTAMHGVGWQPLRRLVAASGHLPLVPVPEQADPDGAFPTVAFPNPEEPGALDLALALAKAEGVDLVLANDPDADRLAVAIPDGAGGFVALTGNQVGVLLADDLLTFGPHDKDRLVATSIVSTSLLARIAAAHGASCVETLTGFKWIANAAIAWKGTFVMGFEEALGYTVGPVVRDKDGLSAALVMLDLAAWCKAQGISLRQHLERLYRRYGYVGSGQRSVNLPGADGSAQIAAMMARLRGSPPRTLGGSAVVRVRDIAASTITDLRTGAVEALDLPKSDVLTFDLADGGRVLARPSGTEPKIKFYVEVLEAMGENEGLAEVEARAQARIRALGAEVLAQASA